MTYKLKISTLVLKRLERVKGQCSGCLFGVMYSNTLLILGFNIENSLETLNYKQIQNNFPAELDLCGLVKFGQCSDSKAHLNEILQDVDVTDNPVLLQCQLGTTVGLKASLLVHGVLEDIQFEVMEEEEMWSELIHVRLRCSLDVISLENEKSLKSAIQNLRKQLASGRIGFNIKDTSIYLTNGSLGTNIIGIKSTSKIHDLFHAANEEHDDGFGVGGDGGGGGGGNKSNKKASKILNTEFDVLKVILMAPLCTNTVNSEQNDKRSCTAPMFYVDESAKYIKIPLQLDSLAILHRNTAVTALYDILIESICRSLRMFEQSIVDNNFIERVDKIGVPRTYNFLPKELGHFFSFVIFENATEDDELQMKQRKKLHKHFQLVTNQPYFRRANKYLFKDERKGCKYLINPHVGIKSQLKNGKQYLVNGKYTYYHYMQDGFNDNGWGCAYRSLQTLCSWFRWQGYSEHPVPDHHKIQKYLFEIGDKPSNFVGSKQWIGSTEVSMCLDGFMKITSRILRVESGSDLAMHGPTLARHFETQGTPIMIGGGVLAHTILGIDFDANANELKFLILDPHYTGIDDLNTVQSKRWCGWKGCDFWDKKSYYNLCMPQLPTTPYF